MHTSGLVITLADEPALAAAALRELAAGPFLLGESRDRHQAAVLETTGPKAAHDWHDWATALPGVTGVEVVFVHWDETVEEVAHAGA
ncbi:MAG: hypothetical protein U0804_06105 [Gemmataceae bacterium]